MSFFASPNRILINNTSGVSVLDTNERLVHFQSNKTITYTFPAVNTGTSVFEANYLLGTFDYSADFFMGYSSGGLSLNGSNIVNYSVAIATSNALNGMRILSFYVSGANIYGKIRCFNYTGTTFPSFTPTMTFYAGNYDL